MPCVDNFVVGHAFRSVPFGTIEHCLAGGRFCRLEAPETGNADAGYGNKLLAEMKSEIQPHKGSALRVKKYFILHYMIHYDKLSIPSLKAAYVTRHFGFLSVEELTLDIGAPFII